MNSGYDLVFDEYSAYRGPFLDRHHCRIWEDGVGCYGSNPNHGMTFDEAKAEVIKWWQNLTEEQFNFDPVTPEVEAEVKP